MGRIIMPDSVNPGSLRGDRLGYASGDAMAAPGRAIQNLGGAIGQASAEMQAQKDKMDRYNAGIAQERFATDAALSYNDNLRTSAPDGSDFVQKQEAALIKAYEATAKTIKSPEEQQRFRLLFEKIRGDQVVKGVGDAREKGAKYVVATTGDSVNGWIASGSVKSKDEFNDYFENAVKPRIDGVIDDPLQRRALYQQFGVQMRDAYFKQHPEDTIPKPANSAGMSDSIKTAAAELGISPVDLATVISYETGGKFSTSIMGGKGGNYMGLIQFGPAERAKYGVSAGQSFPDQMAAVVRYLKDRGLKPGMNIYDLYSTINAGTPGRYGASDGPGNTVKGHVEAMLASPHRKRAEALIGGGAVDIPVSGYELPKPPSGGIFADMGPVEWDKRVAAGRGALKDQLDLGIAQGAIDRTAVEQAPIDDGDKATLLRRWDEANKDGQNMADFLDRLAGGSVNPKDSTDRKMAGKLLDAAGGFKGIAESDPNTVKAMVDFYDRTGMVPDSVKGGLDSMLRSRDPAKVNTGLSILTELYDRNPRAFTQEFDDSTTSLMQQYRSNLRTDTPADSVKRIMEATDPTMEPVKKERRKEAEKTAAAIDLSDVTDLFDPSILPFNEPSLTVAKDAEASLMGDYRAFYVKYFEQTGDDKQAKTMAAEALSRTWGVSQANRGMIMWLPPENTFRDPGMGKVNGSYQWLKDGVEKYLRANGYEHTRTVKGGDGGYFATIKEIAPYHIVATKQTVADFQSGKTPRYELWVTDEDGNYERVTQELSFEVDPARAAAVPGLEKDRLANEQRRKALDEALKASPGGNKDVPFIGSDSLGVTP